MANWEYVRNGKTHRFQTSGERGSTTRIHENISIKNEQYFDKNFNQISNSFFSNNNNNLKNTIDILNTLNALNASTEEINIKQQKERFFRLFLIIGILCPVYWLFYFPLKWAWFGKEK